MSLLVVPGLLAHPAACSAQPALARFAAYAAAPVREPEGLATLACGLVAGLGARPVAALAARGLGLDGQAGYWLVADPVSLVAGGAGVMLAGKVEDLTASDAEELVVALNAHFHDDGVSFVAPRPDLWLAHVAEPPALVTHALDRAAVQGLATMLPAGDAGPQWRRWQDEMQMLLHPHPVNGMRESVGALPANAVWVWGGGRLADTGPVSHIAVDAPATLVGEMLRGVEAQGRAQGDAQSPARRVVVAPAITGDEDVARFAAATLAPAVAALERGDIGELALLADGNGVTAAWLARRPSRWQRIGARWRAPAFTVPEALE